VRKERVGGLKGYSLGSVIWMWNLPPEYTDSDGPSMITSHRFISSSLVSLMAHPGGGVEVMSWNSFMIRRLAILAVVLYVLFLFRVIGQGVMSAKRV